MRVRASARARVSTEGRGSGARVYSRTVMARFHAIGSVASAVQKRGLAKARARACVAESVRARTLTGGGVRIRKNGRAVRRRDGPGFTVICVRACARACVSREEAGSGQRVPFGSGREGRGYQCW